MTVVSVGDYAHAAGELVQELVRVIKIRRLYDPDHPQRQEAEEAALERIGHLLDSHGTIELKVEEERLLAEDTQVYRREAGGDALSQVLHREGIRQLAFYSGLTLQEFIGLVDHVVRASRPGAEDDEEGLVGRLWEERFYHVRYTFVESLQDDEWTPPSAERRAAEEAAGMAPEPVQLAPEDLARAVVRPEIDGSLYFLDDEDMTALQAELEAEKTRTLVHECLTCLRELLIHPARADVRPVLDALAELQAELIEEGAYGDVQRLHQLFAVYLEGDAADDVAREAFHEMRRAALSAETLARLQAQLEAGVVDERTVAGYYRAFGREDLEAVFAGSADLKRLLQRPAVASAIVDLARERPAAVAEALGSSDPHTASAAAFLAGQLTDPRLLDGLGRAIRARDAIVRREAVQALKQYGGGRALDHVRLAVDDPDPGVRLYALRHLVVHRYAPAFPTVAAALADERWRERSGTEQRLLFEAFGALGGERAVEPLVRRVRPRGKLFRKQDHEEVACALVGLGATGSPAARPVVEEAAGSRQPLVAQTAAQVLESWRRAGGTAG